MSNDYSRFREPPDSYYEPPQVTQEPLFGNTTCSQCRGTGKSLDGLRNCSACGGYGWNDVECDES